MLKAKKGDRVEFLMKMNSGELGLTYGVVVKGGSKTVTVRLDGGEYDVKGGVVQLGLSDQPIPKDPPNVMDKYSIKGYRSGKFGMEGTAYTCTLLLNGKKLANVIQGGDGGCNYYNILDYSDARNKDLLSQFHKDSEEWAQLFGDKNPIESSDTWVDWWVNDRPYGKTAAKYFESFYARWEDNYEY